MSYPRVPSATAGPAPEDTLHDFLLDLGARKEFRSLRAPAPRGAPPRPQAYGYGLTFEDPGAPPALAGLRLHGAQLFVRNFENPDTPWVRLLLNWQTGTGKTNAAIAIALEFIRQFKARLGVAPADRPSVLVVGFTRTIIQAELLRHPEFGFVSAEEVAELERLRQLADATGSSASPEARHHAGFVGVLKRRLTDRARGGYFQFHGYKEFANRLFAVTRKGTAGGVTVQGLYARQERPPAAEGEGGDGFEGPTFLERIDAAVEAKDVEVNWDFLAALRGGLLVADEIHNTYNIQTKNNYGVALQYALDKITAEDPQAAPRAVFMSATVTSGSPAEIVDLLNLLVPLDQLPGGRRLRREDFFRVAEGGGVAPRPGALDRIGRLSAGRVSFLLDADEGTYPRRVFEGVPLPDPLAAGGGAIAYLRFTPCPMSPFHAQTLAHMLALRSEGGVAIPANAYTLYDMAYPNPEFPPDTARDPPPAAYGLYLSSETPARLAAAPADWRAGAGVAVESMRGGEVRAGVPALISGAFLDLAPAPRGPPGAAAYTTKYYRLGEDVLAVVRGGPGKIMIYHHRVRMSGVLQLQELLLANGFADETSVPGPNVICAVCGAPRKGHAAAPHDYAPARFVIVNSEVDRSLVDRSIARYNAPSNAEGYEYRVLIGSKIIREGFDLKAVRFLFVASLPTDIPTLIQVFGRAVRKNSHAGLPPDQRDVRIRIYVSTAGAPGGAAPEVARYAEKMRSFFVTQEVERAIRTYAVDGFLNFEKIRSEKPEATIDAIPYEPAVSLAEVEGRPETTATFEAYAHGDREVATLTAVVRALFGSRPAWTYDDLWEAARTPGAVGGLAVDPASFSEESFAVALNGLGLHDPAVANLAADPQAAGLVARVGPFFVRAPAGPAGQPILDVESYVRENAVLEPVRIKVSDYVREERVGHNFAVRLAGFEQRFASPETPIEDAFVDFDADFHYALLRRIVEARAGAAAGKETDIYRRLVVPGGPLHRAADLYRRFRVLVAAADVSARPEAKALLRSLPITKKIPVGYVTETAVRLYDVSVGWYEIPRAALGLGARFAENDVVVGYVERRGAHLRFKVRPPLHQLAAIEVRDVRSLARGAVCETRSRQEQEDLAVRLKATPRPEVHGLGSAELCARIRDRLLTLEETARDGPDGMASGTRWFYLFNEKMPTVSLSR